MYQVRVPKAKWIVLGGLLWLGLVASLARADHNEPGPTGALTLTGKLVTAYDACALGGVCSVSKSPCSLTAGGSNHCSGGSNPGAVCTTNADCTGTCSGGGNPGAACSSTSTEPCKGLCSFNGATPCNTATEATDCAGGGANTDCDNFGTCGSLGACVSAAGCPAGQSCGTADRGQVAYNGGSTSGNAAIPACVPPRRSDPICGFNPAVTTAAGTLTATGSTLTGDLSVVGTLAGLAPACKGHRLRISAVARVTNDNDKMAGCTVAPGSTCTANGTSSACHNPNYGCKAANSPATCCTGNGSGSCPLDNSKCTGAALPFWCCTGAGNGTCGADSSDPCLNQVCGANSVHKGAPCCSGNTTGACGHGGTTIDLTPLFLSILNIPVECRVSSSGACNLNTSVNRAVVSSHCTGRGTADGGNATCCTNAGSGNCTQALCTGTGTPFGCCTGAGNTTTNGCNILSKGNRVGFELKDLGLTRVSGNNVNDFCAGAGKTETGNATCCTGTHAGTCTGAANCVASNNPFQCCTGNGTGPDCQQPTNEANYYCTGSGTPAACCTGVGTGTCTAANCTGSRVPFDCCIAASSGCGQPDYNTQKSFGTGIFDP